VVSVLCGARRQEGPPTGQTHTLRILWADALDECCHSHYVIQIDVKQVLPGLPLLRSAGASKCRLMCLTAYPEWSAPRLSTILVGRLCHHARKEANPSVARPGGELHDHERRRALLPA
jgi:hypothetical protein